MSTSSSTCWFTFTTTGCRLSRTIRGFTGGHTGPIPSTTDTINAKLEVQVNLFQAFCHRNPTRKEVGICEYIDQRSLCTITTWKTVTTPPRFFLRRDGHSRNRALAKCGVVASLGSPWPALLTALTRNSYFSPGVRPVILPLQPGPTSLALTKS